MALGRARRARPRLLLPLDEPSLRLAPTATNLLKRRLDGLLDVVDEGVDQGRSDKDRFFQSPR